YYVSNPSVSVGSISYMFNMDMIGRLDPDQKTLVVNGVGTSPVWEPLVESTEKGVLTIKTVQSGTGPSDYTSFYLEDIPVLAFFTGAHEDYHKPTDDADKINYEGQYLVYQFIINLIDSLENTSNIEFTKTKEGTSQNAPKFTVTLGIIPDYIYEGEGLKITAVTEGKAASRAGLLKDDVIIMMGEHKITDIWNYMTALSAFKAGDDTIVKVRREDEILEFDVLFQ
ncbi:MAG: M28 family peptidase, partial [Bacteroidetes bacterium]|nr:M28 family peptidase [Bacteroidota bacterium]